MFCGVVRLSQSVYAAVGVHDEHDLRGLEQPLGDRERTDHIVGHDPARISNHACITLVEAQDLVRVDACVHAGEDGESLGRSPSQVALVERRGVARVVLKQLVDTHESADRASAPAFQQGGDRVWPSGSRRRNVRSRTCSRLVRSRSEVRDMWTPQR
jgi:hypothetical protein